MHDHEQPNEEAFKAHVENLLNPENCLDIHGVNENKSYSGVCPGIIGILPFSWILFILTIFYVVFTHVQYPVIWCYSRLIRIFKSGSRMLCSNFRGISIMDSLANIYDRILLDRLLLWCNISKCQA